MIAIPLTVTVTQTTEELLLLGAADMCRLSVAAWKMLLREYGEATPC